MPTADEFVRKAQDYTGERASLQQFADWIEENAAAYDDPSVRSVYAAIEGALACYYFDHIGQVALRQEMAKAIRPFVADQLTLHVSYGPDGQVLLRLDRETVRDVAFKPSPKSSDVLWSQSDQSHPAGAPEHQFQHAIL
jgi:hypothetical protein